ncbi:hypothetical protein CB1_001251013 [Camelus ferus]|nr:hypothetical protein CB1_001251013 [Camelus ferus]
MLDCAGHTLQNACTCCGLDSLLELIYVCSLCSDIPAQSHSDLEQRSVKERSYAEARAAEMPEKLAQAPRTEGEEGNVLSYWKVFNTVMLDDAAQYLKAGIKLAGFIYACYVVKCITEEEDSSLPLLDLLSSAAAHPTGRLVPFIKGADWVAFVTEEEGCSKIAGSEVLRLTVNARFPPSVFSCLPPGGVFLRLCLGAPLHWERRFSFYSSCGSGSAAAVTLSRAPLVSFLAVSSLMPGVSTALPDTAQVQLSSPSPGLPHTAGESAQAQRRPAPAQRGFRSLPRTVGRIHHRACSKSFQVP